MQLSCDGDAFDSTDEQEKGTFEINTKRERSRFVTSQNKTEINLRPESSEANETIERKKKKKNYFERIKSDFLLCSINSERVLRMQSAVRNCNLTILFRSIDCILM